MLNKPQLIIANMYRKKDKYAFFAIQQAIDKLFEFDITFHIIWDDPKYKDEWSKKIDKLGDTVVSYTKELLDDYCRNKGIAEQRITEDFNKFKAIYFIIHGHYLKNNNITDYYLIYDDDIILKDDLIDLKFALKHKLPVFLTELNSGCDKVLFDKICNIYTNAIEVYRTKNPHYFGFNAGFQGIDTCIYDDFIDDENFKYLLDLFYYGGIYDDNGKEITGSTRTAIDTQQQSFMSIMNVIKPSNFPLILPINEYFICPNFGNHPLYGVIDSNNEYGGWDIALKSKVVHFIGHTVLDGVYYGKPKVFLEYVDDYLKDKELQSNEKELITEKLYTTNKKENG
jgi:hypothetical protein